MGGASGYIISCPATTSPISSKEATEKQPRRAAHNTARNSVLVPISQGTEVTIVTEYVPFRYFTRTALSIDACMGTSPIMPRYEAERLETKTHVGLGPGESIEYTKHRVSLGGHSWPVCREPLRNITQPWFQDDLGVISPNTRQAGLTERACSSPTCLNNASANSRAAFMENRGKSYDLGSELSGEHFRNITQPWFQDNHGVVRPEFQASRVDGKGLQVSYLLDRCQC